MTERRPIATDAAPAAIGPYSQGIRAGNLLFVSGQIPLVPGTKTLVEGGIAEQTEQALRNVAAVLEAAGSSLARVVKVTVFLADLSEFAAMNEVYARHFPAPSPARSTLAVKTLPMNARVEIDAIALAD